MTTETTIPSRFVLIGNSGVGKSTIVQRYILNIEFDDKTHPTIGAAFYIMPNNKNRKIQIWDTAGQERFRSLCPIYYRGSSGCICVFDLSNRESFDDVDNWINAYKMYASNQSILLIANKNDIDEKLWKVSKTEVATLSKIYNCNVIYTSGRNCTNMEEFHEAMSDLYENIPIEMDNLLNIPDNIYDSGYKAKECSC